MPLYRGCDVNFPTHLSHSFIFLFSYLRVRVSYPLPPLFKLYIVCIIVQAIPFLVKTKVVRTGAILAPVEPFSCTKG